MIFSDKLFKKLISELEKSLAVQTSSGYQLSDKVYGYGVSVGIGVCSGVGSVGGRGVCSVGIGVSSSVGSGVACMFWHASA